MSGGWTLTIEGALGEIRLTQTEGGKPEWSAEGPGGVAAGDLRRALLGAAWHGVDPIWITMVEGAVVQDLSSSRRATLPTELITGQCFHVTFAENRASIQKHGLDWRRAKLGGIARGSNLPANPEADGVFLTRDLEDAQFFARMGERPERGPVDIWAVDLIEQWVIGDPGASGGLNWVICPASISPAQLTLLTGHVKSTMTTNRRL
jgi:hypothetical protein